MRLFSFLTALVLLNTASFGQAPRRSKPFIYSATSDWQKITFKSTSRIRPAPSVTNQPAQPDNTPVTMSQPATTPVNRPAVTQPAISQPSRTQPDIAQPNVVRTDAPRPEVSTPTRVDPPVTQPTTVPVEQPSVADAPVSRPSRTAPSTTTSPDFRPAFTGDFATNRNGWKAGIKGDYHYQIGMGRYSIRKRNVNTQQVAFSYVPLPTDINLNAADLFTIKIDVLADSGRVPTGGLLFGVKDSLNFSAFTLNNKGEVSIIRVTNGETFTDYMPGDFFKPGVPVDRNRNRLTVRRKGYALHFYVNDREIRDSPYRFKMLAGNSVGMISSAYWTAFQKLSVTLGASGPDLPTTYTTMVETPTPTVSTPIPEKKPAPIVETPVSEAPKPVNTAPNTFSETFTKNQNRWLVGQKNGYELEISLGNYYIHKTSASTVNPARSYISLPPTIDLNKAESFTVTIDMIVPPGVQPDGGLLLGVKDVNNFCQFRLMGTNQVSIKSLSNGGTFANYMPGKPTPPRVNVSRERNTLMVKKELNQLHFYINGEEVEDSPHVFRKFSGNKIGVITASKTVKFQNLNVEITPGR
jgi:hypothetical protein